MQGQNENRRDRKLAEQREPIIAQNNNLHQQDGGYQNVKQNVPGIS